MTASGYLRFAIYDRDTGGHKRDGVCAERDLLLQAGDGEILVELPSDIKPADTKLAPDKRGVVPLTEAEKTARLGPPPAPPNGQTVPAFAHADLPVPKPGAMLFVSDAPSGPCFAVSDGVAWFRLSFGPELKPSVKPVKGGA